MEGLFLFPHPVPCRYKVSDGHPNRNKTIDLFEKQRVFSYSFEFTVGAHRAPHLLCHVVFAMLTFIIMAIGSNVNGDNDSFLGFESSMGI